MEVLDRLGDVGLAVHDMTHGPCRAAPSGPARDVGVQQGLGDGRGQMADASARDRACRVRPLTRPVAGRADADRLLDAALRKTGHGVTRQTPTKKPA